VLFSSFSSPQRGFPRSPPFRRLWTQPQSLMDQPGIFNLSELTTRDPKSTELDFRYRPPLLTSFLVFKVRGSPRGYWPYLVAFQESYGGTDSMAWISNFCRCRAYKSGIRVPPPGFLHVVMRGSNSSKKKKGPGTSLTRDKARLRLLSSAMSPFSHLR